MNNDRNIIYVEGGHDAPYVYITSQTLRNALSIIASEDDNFITLSAGSVRVLYDYELKNVLEELDRTGLEYEIRKNNTGDWSYNSRHKMDQGLI